MRDRGQTVNQNFTPRFYCVAIRDHCVVFYIGGGPFLLVHSAQKSEIVVWHETAEGTRYLVPPATTNADTMNALQVTYLLVRCHDVFFRANNEDTSFDRGAKNVSCFVL